MYGLTALFFVCCFAAALFSVFLLTLVFGFMWFCVGLRYSLYACGFGSVWRSICFELVCWGWFALLLLIFGLLMFEFIVCYLQTELIYVVVYFRLLRLFCICFALQFDCLRFAFGCDFADLFVAGVPGH